MSFTSGYYDSPGGGSPEKAASPGNDLSGSGLFNRIMRYLGPPGVVNPAQGVAPAVRADAMLPRRPVEERLTDRYDLPPAIGPGKERARPVPVVQAEPLPVVPAQPRFADPLDNPYESPPGDYRPPDRPAPTEPVRQAPPVVVGRPVPRPGGNGTSPGSAYSPPDRNERDLPLAYATPVRGSGELSTAYTTPVREGGDLPVGYTTPERETGLSTAYSTPVRGSGELSTAYSTPVRGSGELSTAYSTPVRGSGELSTAYSTPVRESGELSTAYSTPVREGGHLLFDDVVPDEPSGFTTVRVPAQPRPNLPVAYESPPLGPGGPSPDGEVPLRFRGSPDVYVDQRPDLRPVADQPLVVPAQPAPVPAPAPRRELPHPMVRSQVFQPEPAPGPVGAPDDSLYARPSEAEIALSLEPDDDDEAEGGLDEQTMERIVERVQHQLARRLEVERERRGDSAWR